MAARQLGCGYGQIRIDRLLIIARKVSEHSVLSGASTRKATKAWEFACSAPGGGAFVWRRRGRAGDSSSARVPDRYSEGNQLAEVAQRRTGYRSRSLWSNHVMWQ